MHRLRHQIILCGIKVEKGENFCKVGGKHFNIVGEMVKWGEGYTEAGSASDPLETRSLLDPVHI